MAAENDGQFDYTNFKLVQEHAKELESRFSERNKVNEKMEDLYWMRWDEEASVKQQIENVKLTKSPRARNAIMGAMRLLIATDPHFIVPHDTNNREAQAVASELEKFATAMWFAAGRVKGDPIHYDVVRSALLFSEVHIDIDSTGDILEYAKGASPAMVQRAEYVNQRTPYLFSVCHPSSGYPEYGPLGLSSFFKKIKVTQAHIVDNWGERGKQALLQNNKEIQRYSQVTLCDFYDLKDRVVWIAGHERPILQSEHELPFIPKVAQNVEGSSIFDKPEEQREPFLYTLYRSGIVNRQNLLLTVWMTLTFALGANPMYVNYLLDPDNPPQADYTMPGGEINLRVGERREPMLKQVIDPSLQQAWQVANDLEMESTIYRQTLGEPLGMNAPYSMVALLSQSGRLPLTVTQRKAGWAIGEALEKAIRWIKFDKKKAQASYEDYDNELEAAEIPEKFDLTAFLDIAMPQDRLNAANTAAVLAQGEEPLVSHAWVLENLLNEGQPEEMTKQIWREKANWMKWQQYTYDQMARIAQMEQQAMMPGTASGMPGTEQLGPMPPGQGAPPTPDMVPNPEPMPPMQPFEPMRPNPEEIA